MPKFYAQIDASGVPIAGFVLETLASAPSSPTNGRSYYDTALNKARTYQNGQWINFADGQVQSVNGHTGIVVLTKSDVGLSSVDNTSDANKPISTATQTALNAKAPLVSPAFSGSPTAPTPTVATGIANKSYVDMAIQGLSAKNSVRVATTGNISLNATSIIDGVGVNPADRVLVKDQTDPSQNGIYAVTGAAWNRSSDFDSSSEIQSGAYVFVEEGDTNKDTGWVLTTDGFVTIGTTALHFTQFSGAGQIVAGAGLIKNGNELSVDAGPEFGFDGIGLRIASSGVTSSMLADGAAVLDGPKVSGTLPISKGGTGANNAQDARNYLDVPGFVMFDAPALTAGVWTKIPTINAVQAISVMSISFLSSASEVFLDWRINLTAPQSIEIKSDIDVPAATVSGFAIGLF